MRRGEELDVGANLHVFANSDRGDVEGDQSPVDEGARADRNLVAVRAPKWRADDDFRADAAKEFAIAAGVVVAGDGVELRGPQRDCSRGEDQDRRRCSGRRPASADGLSDRRAGIWGRTSSDSQLGMS
jgi:hypothetical protein